MINIGGNRWAFKPELGCVRSMGAWTFEAAAATTTIGADFEAVGVSYQYIWGSRR